MLFEQMPLASLIVYMLASLGLAYIVGHSKVTFRFRSWWSRWYHDWYPMAPADGDPWLLQMLECPACFGFWTGLAASVIGLVPFETRWSALAWALFTAGSNFLLGRITGLMPSLEHPHSPEQQHPEHPKKES